MNPGEPRNSPASTFTQWPFAYTYGAVTSMAFRSVTSEIGVCP